MLITNLLPLLARYALGFDLVAGPDDSVTLTIMPRKAGGATDKLEPAEARPIALTGSAAEIDAELAKGEEGALGQLIAARRTLADQIAEQRQAAEAARAAGAQATTVRATTPPKAATTATTAKAVPSTRPPADATAEAPASLW